MRYAIGILTGWSLALGAPLAAEPAPVPEAIASDPVPDPQHPARMVVLHILSGDVEINAIAYVASGAGNHPTLVICHGWPGNEKNLDLAQAVRRAGWNAVTFNYRGSWGSPGKFRFAQNPEDARAVLAYLRNPANAAKLGVDPSRIAVIGHSMGGWVAALIGASDRQLLGVGLISAANMGLLGTLPRAELVAVAADNTETLTGTSPEIMADELTANHDAFDFRHAAAGLSDVPLLALTSNDGLAEQSNALVAAIRSNGGDKVTSYHAPTDHSWSDHRIDLEARVIRWLQTLGGEAR